MIPVNEPLIAPEAKQFVNECLDSGWVSSAGTYVTRLEEEFAEYVGMPYAATTTSGTTALHLALAALRIGPGDEVILPDLTIGSCAFAVMYLGAKPVFVDVEKETGNIDPAYIEKAITKKTKAIMVVHLYGHPAEMDTITAIAKKHNLFVIEDAAEAHGAEYKGKKAGSFGDISCFSFYGNKLITTGEGGMVLMRNKGLYDRCVTLKDLAHAPGKRFWHEELGYNFRMTNMQAALGVAQLHHADEYLAKKRHMAEVYKRGLRDIPYLLLPTESDKVKSSYWMYAVLVTPNSLVSRDNLMRKLKELGVDTRSYFYPLHQQPVVRKITRQPDSAFPVSVDLSQRGLYLPSGLALTEKQMQEVIKAVHKVFSSSI